MRRLINKNINLVIATHDQELTEIIKNCFSDLPITIEVLKTPQAVANYENWEQIDTVLLDAALSPNCEIELVSNTIQITKAAIIVLSRFNDDEIPIQLVLNGAQDFIRVQDITRTRIALKVHLAIARQQLRCELQEAQLSAEKASVEKSNFLAHFSHEIRNPLTTILGAVEIFNEHHKNSEVTEALSASAKKLYLAMNDILDNSKIENGEIPIYIDDTSIEKIAIEVINCYQLQAKKSRISLAFSIESDVPPIIRSDEKRIQQILSNLLSNALKYTQQGSITLKISCYQKEHIKFEVQDTGRGIPGQSLCNLFSEYYQSHTSDNKIGTGLGLSICKKLTTLLGGEIGAENTLNSGALFWFTVRQNSPIVKGKNTPSPNLQTIKSIPSQPNAQIRIIVVDDDSLNRMIVAKILNSEGFNCLECENGEKVLSALQKDNQIEIVLVDINMPGMNGIELVQAIKSQSPKTKIIGLSGDIKSSNNFRKLGMDSFILKPATKINLITTLKRFSNLFLPG